MKLRERSPMTPLPFWLLMLSLAALVLGGRLLAGAIWHGIRHFGRWSLPRLGKALSGARWLDYARTRWPRATRRVAARIALGRFTGLPLTLIAILGVYLIFLGVGLVEDVTEGHRLAAFDHHVNRALDVLRDPHFLHVVAHITGLANVSTLVAVTFVSAGFFWAHRRAVFIPGLVLTVVGSQTLTYIGKYAVDRPRPDFLTFASATTPSFPSGHATGAIAVYGFLAYAIGRDLTSARSRFELGYWTVVLIGLIAASRMVLSVHFTSDIAAGLLVGGFWLLFGFALTEYLRERQALARN